MLRHSKQFRPTTIRFTMTRNGRGSMDTRRPSSTDCRFSLLPRPAELSCKFLREVHSGDTLYSALTTKALEPSEAGGTVVTDVTVHSQNGELVLTGEHKYLLRR